MDTDIPALSGDGPASGIERRTLKDRAIEEVRSFFAMFLYLWIFLGMLSLHERVILRQHGVGWTAQTLAVVNALVLAKVMLVVNDLRPARWMRPHPLLYPVLFDSAVLAVVFILFHEVEEIVVGLIAGESVRASIPVVGGGGAAGVVFVAAIIFVVLIPYLLFQKLAFAMGRKKMVELVFGHTAAKGL